MTWTIRNKYGRFKLMLLGPIESCYVSRVRVYSICDKGILWFRGDAYTLTCINYFMRMGA